MSAFCPARTVIRHSCLRLPDKPLIERRHEVFPPECRTERGERLRAAWVTGAHGSKSGEQQVQVPLPYIRHLQREPPEPAHREALEEFALIGK